MDAQLVRLQEQLGLFGGERVTAEEFDLARKRIERLENNLRGPILEAIRSIRQGMKGLGNVPKAVDDLRGRVSDVEAAIIRIVCGQQLQGTSVPSGGSPPDKGSEHEAPLLDPSIFPDTSAVNFAVGTPQPAATGGAGGGCGGLCWFTDPWKQRVVALEARMNTLEEASQTGRGKDAVDPSVVALLHNSLSKVQRDIADLLTRVDRSSVTMGGRTFTGIADCEEFVHQAFPGHSFDWFYNVLSMLQRVSQTTVSTTEALVHKTHLKKAGYKMQGGGSIRASFLTLLPPVLGKGEGDAFNPTKPLPNIATPELFGVLTEDGLGGRIEAAMAGAVDAINGGIGVLFQARPAGMAVVTAMVRDSWAHWQHIA